MEINYGGVHSSEKMETYGKINPILFEWISDKFNKSIPSRVITMPAESGVQENQILEHIKTLEKQFAKGSSVKLFTYDNRVAWFQTNINTVDYQKYWWHSKCEDIFTSMLHGLEKAPTAVWFDLCGGLSDSVCVGLHAVSKKLLTDDSLIFITLQIRNCRGGVNQQLAEKYAEALGIRENIKATEEKLSSLIITFDLTKVMQKVYYRASTTFCVLGYKLTTKPMNNNVLTSLTLEEKIRERQSQLESELHKINETRALVDLLDQKRAEFKKLAEEIKTLEFQIKEVLGTVEDDSLKTEHFHPREKLILEALADGKSKSIQEIMEARAALTSVYSEATVRKSLEKLVVLGEIIVRDNVPGYHGKMKIYKLANLHNI